MYNVKGDSASGTDYPDRRHFGDLFHRKTHTHLQSVLAVRIELHIRAIVTCRLFLSACALRDLRTMLRAKALMAL